MIQNIRDWTSSWISWVIVVAVCLSFGLWGIHSYFGSSRSFAAVAIVNGEKIFPQALSNAYHQLRRSFEAQFNQTLAISSKLEARLKQQALQQLITEAVLTQNAQQQGYEVLPDQVTQFIRQIPAFQKEGAFSPVRYQQYLSVSGYNNEAFIHMIGTQLLINQVKQGFQSSEFVLPNELNRANAMLNQARDIDYLTISLDKMAVPTATEDDLKAYYEAHKSAFSIPEQVSIEYIELSVPKLAATIKPTLETLQAYYDANVAQYREPAKWELQYFILPFSPQASAAKKTVVFEAMKTLEERLKSGESVMALQKDYPELVVKSEWVEKENLPASFLAQLSNLSKENAISDSIETEKGYVLLKLLSSKKAVTPAFSSIKDKVLKDFKHQQALAKFNDGIEDLTNLTFEQPDSLLPAAEALGLKIQHTELFSRVGGHKGLTANPVIVETAFSEDVLKNGNNSQVINLSEEAQLVLRVKEHRQESVKPYETVKDEVKRANLHDKQKAMAKALADKLKKAFEQGAALKKLATQNNLNYQTLGYVDRAKAKDTDKYLEAGFDIHYSKTDRQSNVVIIQPDENSYALVAINGVKPSTGTPSEQVKAMVADNFSQLAYLLYVNGALNSAKIVKTGE